MQKNPLSYLSVANQIAQLHPGRSTYAQRMAYCLAIYAAGASVWMSERSFDHLLSHTELLAQSEQISDKLCTDLKNLKLAARYKQDNDFSDFPGRCALFVHPSANEIVPSPKKLSSADLTGILTKLFAEVATADDSYIFPEQEAPFQAS